MQPQLGAQQYAAQPSAHMPQPFVFPCGQLLFWLKAILYTLIFLFLFLGFILQLIGIGSAQDDCEDDEYLRQYIDIDCTDFFRSFWWATFFQLLVCLGIGIVMLTGILKDVRVAAVAFLAIVTLQLIDRAEDSLDLRRDSYWNDEDDFRTAAAGYIMSALANFLLLLVLGIKKTPTPTMPAFMNNIPYPQAEMNAGGGVPQIPTVHYPAVAPQPGPAAPVVRQ